MFYKNQTKKPLSVYIYKKLVKYDDYIKKEITFFNKMKPFLFYFDIFFHYEIIGNNVLLYYKNVETRFHEFNEFHEFQKKQIIHLLNENNYYSDNYSFKLNYKNNIVLTNIQSLLYSSSSLSSSSSSFSSNNELSI
uniref:Uncharacterized protein n=1 Tax=viral metagenome TaxID=1070528 RepID=A0A6C0H591_9ZZZZ